MIQGALETARRIAESLMVDTCTITRSPADQRAVLDQETGTYADVPGVPVYESISCQVRAVELQAQTVNAGEQVHTLEVVEVKLPITVTDVDVGDVIDVLTATYDPALAGRTYRVMTDSAKTYATTRRLRCQEVTS